MKSYFDPEFVFSFVCQTPHSEAAHCISQEIELPWRISHLHILQVDREFLRRSRLLKGSDFQVLQNYHRVWKNYLDEAVFDYRSEWRWSEALLRAVNWQRRDLVQARDIGSLIHAALAVENNSAAFASFSPEPRRYAQSAGLKLLPAKLSAR